VLCSPSSEWCLTVTCERSAVHSFLWGWPDTHQSAVFTVVTQPRFIRGGTWRR
jgi:hypothetical protein